MLATLKENKAVLVVGGGISGLTAALTLAEKGIKVYLVEKTEALGGKAIKYGCKATKICRKCSVCLVYEYLDQVSKHENINVFCNTIVEKVEDFDDKLNISLASCNYPEKTINKVDKQIEVAKVIITIGFEPFPGNKRSILGYGKSERVITGWELEKIIKQHYSIYDYLKLAENIPLNIAFIQCVGSRNQIRELDYYPKQYCSQVCCAYALRITDKFIEDYPQINISIYYMDLQLLTPELQQIYEKIKEKKQVKFIRSIPGRTNISEKNKIILLSDNMQKQAVAKEEYDLVILATGICPSQDTETISKLFKINLNPDGFLEKENFNNTVFALGTCNGPKSIEQCHRQAINLANALINNNQL